MLYVVAYIRSPNFSRGKASKVVTLLFHDEEYPERPNAAFDVAHYFARASVGASTTGVIDDTQLVGCVDYADTAWHTGVGSPHNSACEGYEHSGYAHQTYDEWLDAYGVAMLEISARHFAQRCHDLGIPPRKISGAQYLQALRAQDPSQGGIMGHVDVTRGTGLHRNGHYDPGANFPWDYYIARVVHYHSGGADEQPAPLVADPVVHDGNSSTPSTPTILVATVREVQELLTICATGTSDDGFHPGGVDGVFGSRTRQAVLYFQGRAKDAGGNALIVDGVVGPRTIFSLRVCAYLAAANQSAPQPSHTDIPTYPGDPSIVIRRGERSFRVRAVQQRLSDRGWRIVIDSDFGRDTEQVVFQFQRDQHLGVDGLVGPETWGALWRNPVT